MSSSIIDRHFSFFELVLYLEFFITLEYGFILRCSIHDIPLHCNKLELVPSNLADFLHSKSNCMDDTLKLVKLYNYTEHVDM